MPEWVVHFQLFSESMRNGAWSAERNYMLETRKCSYSRIVVWLLPSEWDLLHISMGRKWFEAFDEMVSKRIFNIVQSIQQRTRIVFHIIFIIIFHRIESSALKITSIFRHVLFMRVFTVALDRDNGSNWWICLKWKSHCWLHSDIAYRFSYASIWIAVIFL